jgi:hypothetical protein
MSTITGRIIDESGAGLQGVAVQLRKGNQIIDTQTTDANGTYVFQPARNANYRVRPVLKSPLLDRGALDVSQRQAKFQGQPVAVPDFRYTAFESDLSKSYDDVQADAAFILDTLRGAQAVAELMLLAARTDPTDPTSLDPTKVNTARKWVRSFIFHSLIKEDEDPKQAPTALTASEERELLSIGGTVGPKELCKTCRDRYYTPGTPYYMNYSLYQQCLYVPPCTPP